MGYLGSLNNKLIIVLFLFSLSSFVFAMPMPPWPNMPKIAEPGLLALQKKAPKNLMRPAKVNDDLAHSQAWALPIVKNYDNRGAKAMSAWLQSKKIINYIQSNGPKRFQVIIGPSLDKDRLLAMVQEWPQHFPHLGDAIQYQATFLGDHR